MERLERLISAAQQEDKDAMLEIITIFQPIIRKYVRKMNYDEDFESEIVLHLLEVVRAIDLDRLSARNDYLLIRYISNTLRHRYIYLSKKRNLLRDTEIIPEDEREFDWLDNREDAVEAYSDIETKDLLKKTLTPREQLCVELIVIQGCSATEVAKCLGVTKQAVNQCKNRALKKVRENL